MGHIADELPGACLHLLRPCAASRIVNSAVRRGYLPELPGAEVTLRARASRLR